MKKRPITKFLMILSACLFVSGLAGAAEPSSPQNKLLEIPIGVTQADVTNDGRPDIIINMWVEKLYFSDGYHAIIFLNANGYINEEPYPVFSTPQVNLKKEYWEKEPHKNVLFNIQYENGDIKNEIRIPFHDECMMEDYRLIYDQRNQPYLIRATIGSDWKCKTDLVKFEIFRPRGYLDHYEPEPGGDVGSVGFIIDKKWITEEKYSDVTDAFERNEKRLIEMIQ